MRQFEIFDTGGVDLAVAAARNYRHLRDRKLTVRKTIDGCVVLASLRLKQRKGVKKRRAT